MSDVGRKDLLALNDFQDDNFRSEKQKYKTHAALMVQSDENGDQSIYCAIQYHSAVIPGVSCGCLSEFVRVLPRGRSDSLHVDSSRPPHRVVNVDSLHDAAGLSCTQKPFDNQR